MSYWRLEVDSDTSIPTTVAQTEIRSYHHQMRWLAAALSVVSCCAGATSMAQTPPAQSPADQIESLDKEIRQLKAELDTLRREISPKIPADLSFREEVTVPDLGRDERENTINARPEIFLQTRFAKIPVAGADPGEVDQNFQMTRIETRWAGRVSPRVGAGLELHFEPAAEGTPEEILNDAFLEFYVTRGFTIRAGQFVIPFGFDVQQSSEEREYPERAMVDGYVFPGERDRGILVQWMGGDASKSLANTQVQAALLNGNRFFSDSDTHLNSVLRVRRIFPKAGLSVGVSGLVGSQILEPGSKGSTHVRIGGLDAQYNWNRFGFRFEWVGGTQPATLLSLKPEFTSSFVPGGEISGITGALLVKTSSRGRAYGRYDRLTGDPTNTTQAHAVDIGYLHLLKSHVRLSADYQWKNRPTENDDAVNTRVQITLDIVF